MNRDTGLWLLALLLVFGCTTAAQGPKAVLSGPPPLICLQMTCDWEDSDAGVQAQVECPTKDYSPRKYETPLNNGEVISCLCCKN